MSKRILAMLLAFVLVLGCMPAVALAEEAEPQAHKCEHCDQVPEWIAWDGTTPMEDGKHYQLTAEELKLSAPIALSEGSFVLDLMGHTIDDVNYPLAGKALELAGLDDAGRVAAHFANIFGKEVTEDETHKESGGGDPQRLHGA